jgi:hypothetical protein
MHRLTRPCNHTVCQGCLLLIYRGGFPNCPACNNSLAAPGPGQTIDAYVTALMTNYDAKAMDGHKEQVKEYTNTELVRHNHEISKDKDQLRASFTSQDSNTYSERCQYLCDVVKYFLITTPFFLGLVGALIFVQLMAATNRRWRLRSHDSCVKSSYIVRRLITYGKWEPRSCCLSRSSLCSASCSARGMAVAAACFGYP